jgi:hypothetical protein
MRNFYFWPVTCHRNSGFFPFSSCTRVLNEEIFTFAADPHHFEADRDQDPAFHFDPGICAFDLDPDSTVHSDADLYQDQSLFMQRIIFKGSSIAPWRASTAPGFSLLCGSGSVSPLLLRLA